ncbi:MAG: hypothetical protein IPI18_19510 [Saprospiraceae bacterium]|nr:hypothetical protein [Saprospiraceae bacterium]
MSVNLSVLAASSSTITWSGNGLTSTTGSYNVDRNETTAIPTSPGMHDYSVTVSASNGCSKTGSITLIVDTPSIVDAGPDQIICATDTIYLHATLGGVATALVWQKNIAYGVFIGPDTDPNAKFVLNGTGQALDSIRFGVMSDDPGGNVCSGGVDTVTIFIEKAAYAFAGPDARVCQYPDSFQLNGSIGGSATKATWSTDNGTGTFTPSDTALSAVYHFGIADSGKVINLYLTTDDAPGLCGAGRDTLKLTIDQASIVDAGPDQTICANDTIYLHATLGGVATALVCEEYCLWCFYRL